MLRSGDKPQRVAANSLSSQRIIESNAVDICTHRKYGAKRGCKSQRNEEDKMVHKFTNWLLVFIGLFGLITLQGEAKGQLTWVRIYNPKLDPQLLLIPQTGFNNPVSFGLSGGVENMEYDDIVINDFTFNLWEDDVVVDDYVGTYSGLTGPFEVKMATKGDKVSASFTVDPVDLNKLYPAWAPWIEDGNLEFFGDGQWSYYLKNDVNKTKKYSLSYSVPPIPAPSALLLLVSGLAGVVGLRRKRLLK